MHRDCPRTVADVASMRPAQGTSFDWMQILYKMQLTTELRGYGAVRDAPPSWEKAL